MASSAITKFATKFYNELDKNQNLVASPLSAEFILSLLTLGTTDLAHSEFLTALGITDDDSIRSSFSMISSKLRSINGVTLNIANKVFIQEGPYDLQPQLKEDAVTTFDAGMAKINFGDSISSVSKINEWVANKTNHKIKDLLSKDSVDKNTRLVLVNAIYFKGTWSKQFDPQCTRQNTFHLNADSTVQVSIMYKKATYTHGVSADLKAKELQKDRNVVSSPLSVEFLLALLTLGTTDPAHSELLTALGMAGDDSIRYSFSEISSKLRSFKSVTLNIANKVYIQKGPYNLQPQLKEDAVTIFNADIENVNFGDNVTTVNDINEWVEHKTNHKIKDLLSKDSVDRDTRLVLINAIYFRGTWAEQFNSRLTQEQTFHLNANSTVKVPMMFNTSIYLYGDSKYLNTQLIQIPYIGGEASMVILLPNEIEGLNEVMSKLAAGYDFLYDIKKNTYSTEVEVTIPKFKIETEIDLNAILPKLGIYSIFNRDNSGLTKIINNNETLYVSKAVQKAYIEVNEEGVEAAAASYMDYMDVSAWNIKHVFCANRPFLYLLLGADLTPMFIGVFRGLTGRINKFTL